MNYASSRMQNFNDFKVMINQSAVAFRSRSSISLDYKILNIQGASPKLKFPPYALKIRQMFSEAARTKSFTSGNSVLWKTKRQVVLDSFGATFFFNVDVKIYRWLARNPGDVPLVAWRNFQTVFSVVSNKGSLIKVKLYGRWI